VTVTSSNSYIQPQVVSSGSRWQIRDASPTGTCRFATPEWRTL